MHCSHGEEGKRGGEESKRAHTENRHTSQRRLTGERQRERERVSQRAGRRYPVALTLCAKNTPELLLLLIGLTCSLLLPTPTLLLPAAAAAAGLTPQRRRCGERQQQTCRYAGRQSHVSVDATCSSSVWPGELEAEVGAEQQPQRACCR